MKFEVVQGFAGIGPTRAIEAVKIEAGNHSPTIEDVLPTQTSAFPPLQLSGKVSGLVTITTVGIGRMYGPVSRLLTTYHRAPTWISATSASDPAEIDTQATNEAVEGYVDACCCCCCRRQEATKYQRVCNIFLKT